MPSLRFENITPTFPFTSKRLNMLGSTVFVVCGLLNTLFLTDIAVWLVIAPDASMLLYFDFKKHHLYFWFCILTTRGLFYFLFSVFWRINTYTVPFVCVEKVQKPKHHLSVSTLRSKIIVPFYRFLSFQLENASAIAMFL